MVELPEVLADLMVETHVVDQMLGELRDEEWELPTPAAGWAVRDQVSHLAFFDDAALLAASDPDRFRAEASDLLDLGPEFPDVVAARYRTLSGAALASWFRSSRMKLYTQFSALDGKLRVPWYGPDMSILSSATARLMETWAHGRDLADTLQISIAPSNRIRHIAHLGVRTFGFSFQLRGLPVPEAEVRVELTAPDGDIWVWGASDADERVSGSALDFCLVVTQRRHVADTDLTMKGEVATAWMAIAQAFAGAPGPGRPRLGRETAE